MYGKLTRRSFAFYAAAFATTIASCSLTKKTLGDRAQVDGTTESIPVILDTDIGDDIDDTWALLMLLRLPQLDLKLVVTDFGNTIYRSRLAAKLLEVAGRSDVPIGVGKGATDDPGQQSGWLGDYRLQDYAGAVYYDGVQALIDTIHESKKPITLICIGPVPNIAEALRRDPSIAEKARFIGMHGSIFAGYDGAKEPAAEWNVKVDPQSLRQVFAAPWDCTITPLDTCGTVRLSGDNYRRVYESDDPALLALRENYAAWLPGAPFVDPATDVSKVSTTLFDTVAIYLAAEQHLVEMQDVPLRVTDEGFTVVDEVDGRIVHCATAWKTAGAFEKRLSEILVG